MVDIKIENHFDDLVFEGRNKHFGAYLLRKVYDKNISKALFLSSVSFIGIVLMPFVYYKYFRYTSHKEDQEEVTLKIEQVNLTDVKEIPVPPPPPRPKIEQPKVKTVKFVPPVVKKDELVPEYEEIPEQEALENAVISNETVEGEENTGVENLIESGDGNGIGQEQILSWVAQMPDFVGGHEKLQEFFARHIRFPQEAMLNNIEGKVWISFVVHKDGSLSDFKVIKSLGHGCDDEAMRVAKMMPKWIPGKANGEPKTVQRKVPIDFILNN